MKKLFTSLLFLIACAAPSFAAYSDDTLLNRSSFTTSNDTLVAISSTSMAGGVFVGVVVSSSMGAGLIQFWDSVGVKSSTIGFVSLATAGSGPAYIPFEVRVASGITYTTTGNTAGVSIIYKNLRAAP